MNDNEIRAALKLRRVSIAGLARSLGVSSTVIHRAISGEGRSRTAEVAISEAIGKSRFEVFGPNRRESGGENSGS